MILRNTDQSRDNILIIRTNGLSGIREAISTASPQTEYQRCLVHPVRNTLKYVADKDRKLFTADLKRIYHAPNADYDVENRDEVTEKWSEKYPTAMKSWTKNRDAITPIFKFSSEGLAVI